MLVLPEGMTHPLGLGSFWWLGLNEVNRVSMDLAEVKADVDRTNKHLRLQGWKRVVFVPPKPMENSRSHKEVDSHTFWEKFWIGIGIERSMDMGDPWNFLALGSWESWESVMAQKCQGIWPSCGRALGCRMRANVGCTQRKRYAGLERRDQQQQGRTPHTDRQ